ncbi:hypothetical protein ACFWC2_14235 [Streptomyces diastaticus]|uniref:hypothetical protein n=1 Tax=Streptomyces diastaticus TaxID=1956 RepID=UPI0033DC84D8
MSSYRARVDHAAALEAAEITTVARLRAERALTHPAQCPCDACRVTRLARQKAAV